MMRKALQLFAICLAGAGASGCHRSMPPARPPFSVTAVVASMDAGTITLRHKSGQRILVAITPGTTVTKRGTAAAVADIAVGMRVVVVYRLVDGAAVADEVRLFRPPINYP
jgi:hypothetical protein